MSYEKPPVAVITGASSGIGKEAAKALASSGWRVIGIGRDAERCAQALAELTALAPAVPPSMIVANLSLMSETDRAAREIASQTDAIDVLVNNAGGIAATRKLNSEGLEDNFASNHLGHFLLVNRLLPLLRSAVSSSAIGFTRIINTSSSAHLQPEGFDWEDLQMMDNWVAGPAYCNAKLANVVFAKTLARRLEGDGIVTYSMHPGTVATNFASYGNEQTQAYLRSLAHITVSATEGADTLIWLATERETGIKSGSYVSERAIEHCNPVANDVSVGDRLWEESVLLIRSAGATVDG